MESSFKWHTESTLKSKFKGSRFKIIKCTTGVILRLHCAVKSRMYESRNNEYSHYKEVRSDDIIMQVSTEKFHYNEWSQNYEVKDADGGPS